MNTLNIDFNENFNLDADQIYFDYNDHVLKLKDIYSVETGEHVLFKNEDNVLLVCSTLSSMENAEEAFEICFSLYNELV